MLAIIKLIGKVIFPLHKIKRTKTLQEIDKKGTPFL